jgi:hypothetical protein
LTLTDGGGPSCPACSQRPACRHAFLLVDRLFSLYLGTDRGPFARMDAVGLDVVLDIEDYADERPRPA